jgi:hypothetical protein
MKLAVAAAVTLAFVVFPVCGAESKSLSDFGVTGDGKTDDTAAIQRAVDAGMGDIRFGRGTFRISKPIVVNLDRTGPVAISGGGVATILMSGAGPAFRIAGTHTGTAAPNTVKPEIWTRQRAPMIDGVEIVGEHQDASGIELQGLMQPTLTRVVVRNALHGIRITGRNRNVIISDCHIYDNRGAGILLEDLNLHQINISGAHISYNGGGGIVVRRSEVRNIQIGTSDIEANMDPKGPPAANILFDAREGSILEGAITGCTIQHTQQAPESANIRLIGRSAEDPNKVGNLIISGNVFSDVSLNLHLRHARGVVITANTFWKGWHHILVEGSTNILLGPNMMDRNPDYREPESPNDVVFTDSTDSAITGLHVNGARGKEAALVLRRCRRFRLSNNTFLDSGDPPVLLEDTEEVER